MYDRRRATRGRRERAPRWDGQLAPQSGRLSVSQRRRWQQLSQQQQQYSNKDSASDEDSAPDRFEKVARVSTSVSNAASSTGGVGKKSEGVSDIVQAKFSSSTGGAIPLSGRNGDAVVRPLSGSSQSGLSDVDCDMVSNHHGLPSSSVSPKYRCASSSIQSEQDSPRSDETEEVQAEGGCVLVGDDVPRSLLSGLLKIVEEQASSPRVVGASKHMIVRDICSRNESLVDYSDDEATSLTQSPTRPRQLVIQPVAGDFVRRKSQRDVERLEEVAALLRSKNHWKLRAIRAENELVSVRNGMEDSNNLFGLASPASPAKSSAVEHVHNSSEDGTNSIALELSGDGPRSDFSRASSCFHCDGERKNGSAGSKGSPPSTLGKESNCGKVALSSLGSKKSTTRKHSIRNEGSGVSDGCDSPGQHMHSYFGDNKPFLQAPWRQEIDCLKEELRKAEIRQAVAEATATSILQRARAAELSRDVKEIQVRI